MSVGGVTDKTGGLGTNAYDNGAINMWARWSRDPADGHLRAGHPFVTDKVATRPSPGWPSVFTCRRAHGGHSASTAPSVNPARSIGLALFAGGTAISQLWLFIVAPLIGGVLAALIWKGITPADLETADTDIDGVEADVDLREVRVAEKGATN